MQLQSFHIEAETEGERSASERCRLARNWCWSLKVSCKPIQMLATLKTVGDTGSGADPKERLSSDVCDK